MGESPPTSEAGEPLELFLLKLYVKLRCWPHTQGHSRLRILTVVSDQTGPYKEPHQVIILAQSLLHPPPEKDSGVIRSFCLNTILHLQHPFQKDVLLEQHTQTTGCDILPLSELRLPNNKITYFKVPGSGIYGAREERSND